MASSKHSYFSPSFNLCEIYISVKTQVASYITREPNLTWRVDTQDLIVRYSSVQTLCEA